jgi:hypothetical protein
MSKLVASANQSRPFHVITAFEGPTLGAINGNADNRRRGIYTKSRKTTGLYLGTSSHSRQKLKRVGQ